MKLSMINIKRFALLIILINAGWLWPGWAAAKNAVGLPGPGDVIGHYGAPAPPNAADAAYLGLEPEHDFQPAALQAEFLLVEVFNVYCASCIVMRPIMNELHARIEADPDLQGRVKMLGIAAGNDQWDIQYEESTYDFPILPDDDYVFHRMVGQPPTPFLIFARPYSQGRLLVVDSHLGRVKDSDALFAMLRAAFRRDISTLKINEDDRAAPWLSANAPVIPVSEEDMIEKVKQSMRVDGRRVEDIAKIELPGWDHIYTGRLDGSGKRVFARVVGRKIPCIDCHDVFFIYSFDENGNFLNFIPISIFKYGNRSFAAADVAQIQSHFHGKSLLNDFPFNSKIDAVSSATISTELIFSGIDETDRLIEDLVKAGHLPSPGPRTAQ